MRLLGCCLLLALFGAAAPPARAQDSPPPPDFAAALTEPQRAYWRELVARAEAAGLWRERLWHLLLHYVPAGSAGAVESEADGAGFFLAPGGKTHPRAELEGTLAAFFSSASLPPAGMTPQCTFPARYRWLAERLDIDPRRLPPQPCERFEQWLARVQPESVSLIFASYFFNNPASMFGHTLLRFNRRGREGDTALLDSALNYSATIPEGEGNFAYAWRGITGGYRGYFSLLPYYLKVREYNDLENRDLWEFRLALTPAELERLLHHAWELGSTYFDYTFMHENCSYHLLSLLEVARPSLHLRDAFHAVTLPTETVQQVLAHTELLAETLYRPSLGSRVAQVLDALDADERRWVRHLIEAPERADEPAFAALPRARAALVLDAAIGHHQYRLAARPQGEAEAKARLRALLLRRSRIPAEEAPPLDAPPRSAPPHEGHASRRMAVAGGAARPPAGGAPAGGAPAETLPFLELSIQPVFHDLLSDDRAFAPNSQIQLLHLRGRYETEAEAWRLERLALVDVRSLFPVTLLSAQLSWRMEVAWQRNRDIGCEACTPFGLVGGIGSSVQSALHRREVFYVLLEAAAEFDREFQTQHRAGYGLGAGVLVDLAEGWRLGLQGRRMRYTQGQRGEVAQLELEQRLALTRNAELVLLWRGVEDYREATLGLGYYF